MIVEVVVDRVTPVVLGEFRLPGETGWLNIEDIEKALWAGPIDLPFTAEEMEICAKAVKTNGPARQKKPPKRPSAKHLRKFKKRHGHCCAVCGWKPPRGYESMIEAHHIVPVCFKMEFGKNRLILLLSSLKNRVWKYLYALLTHGPFHSLVLFLF